MVVPLKSPECLDWSAFYVAPKSGSTALMALGIFWIKDRELSSEFFLNTKPKLIQEKFWKTVPLSKGKFNQSLITHVSQKYCLVRNPYYRAISTYLFICQRARKTLFFREFQKAKPKNSFICFLQFLIENSLFLSQEYHLRVQSSFLPKEYKMSSLISMESFYSGSDTHMRLIPEDLKFLREIQLSLKHHNRRSDLIVENGDTQEYSWLNKEVPSYKSLLTENSKSLIREIYSADEKIFKYYDQISSQIVINPENSNQNIKNPVERIV